MITDVASILKVCGIGHYLHFGDGQQTLVFELIKRSIDAHGIDPSATLVQQNQSRAPGRFTQGNFQQYPFNKETFDTVIIGSEIVGFDTQETLSLLKNLYSTTKRNLVLYFTPDILQAIASRPEGYRLFWEKLAIAAGFRRHPREMLVTPYQALENESVGTLTFFERIPEAALQKFPMQWLLDNRDLHMDMLREAGRRSDGHVSRYVLAASRIHAGDTVLDAACGLGYGTAVLAACSEGARFIGVDIDPLSADYANMNFAANNPTLSYRACDVTQLTFIPDHSVDVVVSFETIEHLENYDLFLSEVKRVLKPDGRFIGSVPNLWCDETGKDPNPYHFHVFDWQKLHNDLNRYFIVDGRWAQTAGGGFKLRNGKREMQMIHLQQAVNFDTEWWIFSANMDPRKTKELAYTNPFHRHASTPAPDHVDFEKFYDNPWLYRVLVQQGIRLLDDNTLLTFCIEVANESRKGSADQGAALCVIGYRILESGHIQLEDLVKFAKHVNDYEAAHDPSNIHAYRWNLSLHYVSARLLLAIGQRDEALNAFLACAALDPTIATPLLATKTISSRFYAGIILVGNENIDAAREQFQLGIKEAHRVLQGDWKNIIGDFERPLTFGLAEAAEVLHTANQCAEALAALERQNTTPGYFWDHIHLKFFGLLEWNRGLENENNVLKNNLAYLLRKTAVSA
ncbi:MAG: methyltransferase domain-containing protein [Gammaproteobacteria bacterium]|nr:methyltransferase domain-containing protein [Gammaproteobacteria bacterium]